MRPTGVPRIRLKSTFWIGIVVIFILVKGIFYISDILFVRPSPDMTASLPVTDDTVWSNVYSFRHHHHTTTANASSIRNNKIAICISGQLARLELVSKIRNIIVPTMLSGDRVHVFVYLDSAIDDVGQTLYGYNYSNSRYNKYATPVYGQADLQTYIEYEILRQYNHLKTFHAAFQDVTLNKDTDINVHVRIEAIARVVFHVVDGKPPVDNKTAVDTGFVLLLMPWFRW
jgi:hypothetical protein